MITFLQFPCIVHNVYTAHDVCNVNNLSTGDNVCDWQKLYSVGKVYSVHIVNIVYIQYCIVILSIATRCAAYVGELARQGKAPLDEDLRPWHWHQ